MPHTLSTPPPAPPPPPPRDARLSDRVRLVRNVLPLVIVLVVIGVELLIARLDREKELLAHLLFYGLVGPAVTFFSVEWITQGTRAREHAEQELRELYVELSATNGQLRAVQEMMRDLSDAPDLAAAVEVAARGAVKVTGATHATLSVAGGLSAQARGETLLSAPSADLYPLRVEIFGGGMLTLHFSSPPSAQLVSLAEALAGEIANGVEAARQRTLDLLTLFSVDQSIRAERNMRRLLSRITHAMAEHLGADARAAYLFDQDGVLRLEYAQDATGREAEHGNPAPPFALRVAEEGQPLLLTGAEAQGAFPLAESVLGLPMRDDQGPVGVLVLANVRADAFEGARVPLLAFMAGQATLAVRNARAYLYSEELAISDERARIAREIHDGVAQSLAFVALKLDLVGRKLRSDPDKAEEEVKAASALLREQIREVRRSIFALRPVDLERYGLLETVRRYVLDFGEQNGVKTQLDMGGDLSLSAGDEAVMFRILQESLNNVAKHARAREVSVTLHAEAGAVLLRVRDDGAGFDPAAVSGRVSTAGGLGLVQMEERLQSRGGKYRISSAPGEGTTVEAWLPQT